MTYTCVLHVCNYQFDILYAFKVTIFTGCDFTVLIALSIKINCEINVDKIYDKRTPKLFL